ncbi:HAD family hydrolase [Klugiella xanthotipulae]|uniref:Sugar-phosphatase n=1 Tax=Klugiella xanthotipulae TaxID=244735 RepID=A0A543I684_9MICO|nr:HAD-IA family hydrolase [Klugiella xanthotipulae]TQM66112.1 sugar-phosphatase [Klugiella xanthotipulae]
MSPVPLENPRFTGEFDAVLCDLDGTLIDSTPAVIRCWTRLAVEEGLDPRRLMHMHGMPAEQLLARLLPAERVPAALARIIALEESDTAGVVALPGARELFDSLPENKRAIVTSCTRTLALVRLREAGITPPATLVSFDDVTNGKPHPEPFQLGAERLGVSPARCLVVEDAPAGLAAGRAAGSTTLGTAGTHPAHELNADCVTDSLARVTAIETNGVLTISVV